MRLVSKFLWLWVLIVAVPASAQEVFRHSRFDAPLPEQIQEIPFFQDVHLAGLAVQGDQAWAGSNGDAQFVVQWQLSDGKVLNKGRLPDNQQVRDIAVVGDALYVLTFTGKETLIYQLAADTFKEIDRHTLNHEYWGIAANASTLALSDRSDTLRLYNRTDLSSKGQHRVRIVDQSIFGLSALTWVGDTLWGTVWPTDYLVSIRLNANMASGMLNQRFLLTPLRPPVQKEQLPGVVSAISFDTANKKLYIGGVDWPTLFTLPLPAPHAD